MNRTAKILVQSAILTLNATAKTIEDSGRIVIQQFQESNRQPTDEETRVIEEMQRAQGHLRDALVVLTRMVQ